MPDRIRHGGNDVTFDAAIAAATSLLTERARSAAGLPGARPHHRGPQAGRRHRRPAAGGHRHRHQRRGGRGILAGQRRGRAAATLGELKNRADLVLFWGSDPARTHPRLIERLVNARGTHIPDGRASRTVVSVRIGADGAVEGADSSIQLTAAGDSPPSASSGPSLPAGRTGDVLDHRRIAGTGCAPDRRPVRGDRGRWRGRRPGATGAARRGAGRAGAGPQHPHEGGALHPAERRQPERCRVAAHLADWISLRSGVPERRAGVSRRPSRAGGHRQRGRRPARGRLARRSRPRPWTPSRRCRR